MAIKIYSEGGSVVIDDGIEVQVSSFSYYEEDSETVSIVNNDKQTNAWNDFYYNIQTKSGAQAGATMDLTLKYLSDLVSDAVVGGGALIQVTEVSDLPLSVGGVITLLDNVTYRFLNHIDLLGERLVGGSNTTILGESSENCSITSTGIGTSFPSNYLFESLYTTPIRHITFKDVPLAIGINVPGTGVQPIALDWTGVNFSGCTTNLYCGEADNFIFDKGAILGSGTFIFDDSIGTIGIANSIFVGSGSDYNMIELTANCIITRRLRISYSSLVAFGSTKAVDVDVSATVPTETFILDTVNFSGGGTYLPGVDNTSNKSLFVNCVGLQNTAVNGQIYMQDNATTTTASSDNQKYSATDNRLTNEAVVERKYLIQCNLSFTSGNNKVCQFGFYDSKLAAIRVPSKTKSTSNGSGRAENISFNCVVNHSVGDYLEIWCANVTDTADITVTDLNFVITEIN
jgi:hypothetical protein